MLCASHNPDSIAHGNADSHRLIHGHFHADPNAYTDRHSNSDGNAHANVNAYTYGMANRKQPSVRYSIIDRVAYVDAKHHASQIAHNLTNSYLSRHAHIDQERDEARHHPYSTPGVLTCVASPFIRSHTQALDDAVSRRQRRCLVDTDRHVCADRDVGALTHAHGDALSIRYPGRHS